MQVLCRSLALDPWLDGVCLPVHSRFEAGINLDLGDRLAFVGNKLGELLPGGLLLAPEDIPALTAAAVPGNTHFAWDEDTHTLRAGSLILSLDSAVCYDARLTPGSLPVDSLERLDRWADLDAPTGLGPSVGVLSDPNCSETADLRKSVFSRSPDFVLSVLRRWVGRGPGLTPSGDDLITGLLAVHTVTPFLGPHFLAALLALLGQGYTTDASVSYYRWGLEGRFAQSVTALFTALQNFDEPGLSKAAIKMVQFGHTSGRDLLAGLRLGLALSRLEQMEGVSAP